jgi:hypothetical protein
MKAPAIFVIAVVPLVLPATRLAVIARLAVGEPRFMADASIIDTCTKCVRHESSHFRAPAVGLSEYVNDSGFWHLSQSATIFRELRVS